MHRPPIFEPVAEAAAEQQRGTLEENPQLALVPVINSLQPYPMGQPAMPWKSESMPWKKASDNEVRVVEFTAHGPDARARSALLHQKRKPTSVVAIPAKQMINQEQMIARFNGLHISTNYVQHSAAGSDMLKPESDFQIAAKNFHNMLNTSSIIICDEMKKMYEKEQLKFKIWPMPIPAPIPIENPSKNALVLWHPPSVRSAMKERQKKKEKPKKI